MAEWRKRCLGEITSFMAKGIPPKYVERETEDTVRVLNQKCNRNFEINYEESRLHDCSKVSAKYSCGFSNLLNPSIIVNEI